MKKVFFFILSLVFFTSNVKAVINDYIDNAGTLDYDKAVKNGYIEMKSRKPINEKEFDVFLMYSGLTGGEAMSRENCNNDYTQCDFTLHIHEENEQTVTLELKYPKLDEEVAKRVAKYEENYKNLKDSNNASNGAKLFSITDLDVLNFYFYNFNNTTEIIDEAGNYDFQTPANTSIKFMTDFKKTYGNSNIEFKFYSNSCNLWWEAFDNSDTGGDLLLFYDGIIYGFTLIDLEYLNIIYVPSDTDPSEEATLAAAKKRLKDYFGKDFTFEVSRPVTEDNNGYWPGENLGIGYFGDREKMSENIYYVTINNIQFEFLIIRDSSKMVDPTIITSDLKTDISVEIENELVPKDTTIAVEEIINNDEIKEKLNKEGNVYTFDISLFSKTIDEYITKTDDKFIVKIPVPKELEGKELIVEFIKTDGSIEEHEVTIENGYAVFETNHFSTYSLSELTNKTVDDTKDKTDNPETGDTILVYAILLIISLLGITISSIKLVNE